MESLWTSSDFLDFAEPLIAPLRAPVPAGDEVMEDRGEVIGMGNPQHCHIPDPRQTLLDLAGGRAPFRWMISRVSPAFRSRPCRVC